MPHTEAPWNDQTCIPENKTVIVLLTDRAAGVSMHSTSCVWQISVARLGGSIQFVIRELHKGVIFSLVNRDLKAQRGRSSLVSFLTSETERASYQPKCKDRIRSSDSVLS